MRMNRAQPAIGWVLIARTEVAKAEGLLQGDGQGVVDELGLLSIHQAIADRLFPGTSVLHTRLRYALFVPWLMQLAAADRNPLDKLKRLEYDLTGLLIEGTRTIGGEAALGIIGSMVYRRKKEAAQPPSYSYWSALATWGILGRRYLRSVPSREAILDELASQRTSSGTDADGQALAMEQPAFDGLPSPPKGFMEEPKGLTFALRPGEKTYLARRLTALKAPAEVDGSPRESFLAALARGSIKPLRELQFWDDADVCARVPPEDKDVIPLARNVSALGGVARAVYLALVEQASEKQGLDVGRMHRNHLEQCRTRWGAEAVRADLDQLVALRLGLKHDKLFDLLSSTQAWLRGSAGSPGAELAKIFADVERKRKTSRARLGGTKGAAAQLERWARFADRSRTAERLHFRWRQVGNLLRDMHE
jgi:Family of unknown function (DUF6361)